MHILLTIPHFHAAEGGAEAYAVTVVRGLQARGHQLEVVAQDGSEIAGIPLHLGPLVESTKKIRELRNPDIVVDWGLNVPADLHRLGGGTHAGFLPYSLASYSQPLRALKAAWYRFAPKHRREIRRERELLANGNTHVLAVSQFVADQIPQSADLPAEHIHVLHNGVDIDRFDPVRIAAYRAPLRKRLGLADDQAAFLMVAHNLQLKNFALMRRVFSQVHRQNPLVRLVVLGKRPPPCTAPWLIYAASTESPEQIYAACDALVHPTFYDACANVVLEAMACGLPVLSSDRNGSAELLDPDMRRALEPAKWAEWIAAVSDDLDYRQLLAVAARRCAENHGIEEYIMQFEELLARLVGDHPLGQQS